MIIPSFRELLEDCNKRGLRMYTAGKLDKSLNGYFMPVTIVDNPPEDARVVTEERVYFFSLPNSPTMMGNADEYTPIAFGPVCPLLKWKDEDEVVQRAGTFRSYKFNLSALNHELAFTTDDSPFGLGGTIWGVDIERATRIAGRLTTGTVWINQWLSQHPAVPFGGHKVTYCSARIPLGIRAHFLL
jgi:acyl-CoA reductase-like NAD-dependent aldehyde dehydrogenase